MKNMCRLGWGSLILSLLLVFPVGAQKKAPPKPSIYRAEGRLAYLSDDRGNRPLDYSYCGYHASEQEIPVLPAVVRVSRQGGDETMRIQRALDYVASLPADREGRRGAVVLDSGLYEVSRPLVINVSGVVLRGAGRTQTTLRRVGTAREPLIRIIGTEQQSAQSDTLWIEDNYLPLGTRHLTLAVGSQTLQAGDRLLIVRPSTREWIASLRCNIFGGGIDALGWKPGDMDLRWDRRVLAAEGNKVEIDAPLTMALDTAEGKPYLLRVQRAGRIREAGVEGMTLISAYDASLPMDEDHCWTGVSVSDAEDVWVRQVDFRHFAGSAVILSPSVARATVEDCRSYAPVSERGGMRRQTFYTLGQQTLFQRCYAERGIHDFAVGFCAPGPNAFVQCEAVEALGYSGGISSWACGVLYDVVDIDGHNLTFANLGQDKNGAGWNVANGLFWQCTAAEIECYAPTRTEMNRAFGCWAQFSGDGEWFESNNHISPRSIYYAQLEERLGKSCAGQSRILERDGEATSSPTIEQAMAMTEAARLPRLTLEQWIAQAPWGEGYAASARVPEIGQIKPKQIRHAAGICAEKALPQTHYAIVNGKLTVDGALITGAKLDATWWSGRLKPNYLPKTRPAITRFVPDREGQGLTDCIDTIVAVMKRNHQAVYDQNYGLWYERRRDDHERIRRRDGDVWAPFYEQPFARSGEGTAWDGLSRYDLTRPNRWYYDRMKEFAHKAAPEGILLFDEHFFQHNILEAGAHWVDSPWRTVNNVNDTQFPEPVPFAGDKRVFMAEHFYDVNHPIRRELYREYIRRHLTELDDCPNAYHLISAEFTGPLHFVRFWVDVIAEWEAETGRDARVALATTKDVQDAILSDPRRAAVIDVIDIRYWHYNTTGLWAPEGGKNMAPRQHMRKMKVGKTTFDEAYKAVAEYRALYPEKAVTFYAQNYPALGWAVLMAGGSCPNVRISDETLRKDIVAMNPVALSAEGVTMIASEDGAVVRYEGGVKELTLPIAEGRYDLYAISGDGSCRLLRSRITLSLSRPFRPEGGSGAYWLKRR